MPLSVRHFADDDKLCHHLTLDVLHDLFPLEEVSQVLTVCHTWEKRERALNMVTILYLVMALTLFPRLGGWGLAQPGQWSSLLVA